MATNSRSVVELNDLIDRLDSLILALSTATDENKSEDDASDHEVEEEKENFDQISQVEKEIRRKLMEIHSRLKNNANYLNFGDEESFFDEADHDEDETQSRAERRRKVSQQQQQQRQDEEVDESEPDTNDLDATKPPHPLPMLTVNSIASASSVAKSALLTTDRAKTVLRQCLVVFGCELENEEAVGAKKRIQFSDESKALAAQLVAELARSEMGRRLALQQGVIAAVGLVLGDEEEKEKEESDNSENQKKSKKKKMHNECSLETAVQVCRILGNLCFDCPEGRKQVLDQQKSLEKLSRLARNRESRAREDPGQRLPVILPGFLLNLCNTTPEAVDVIGKLGFVDVIVSNILSTRTNDAVFNASLNLLICLSEELETAKTHINLSNQFPAALTHILEFTTSPEVTQTVLELVRALIDCPVLALHLAKHTKLFETFLSHIVGKWQTSSEFELLRADACELLVVFLSHDDCMKEIYNAGNGKFLETFTEWLNLNDDPSLQVSAALALGNFACNEDISLQLVSESNTLTDKMIRLLSDRQNPANDFKLQHAILGALRNFSVTAKARPFLLSKGILFPCLSLFDRLNMSSPAYHAVIFKLLGTLRLLVEGHPEAVAQIVESPDRENVVSRLEAWGSTPEAPQGIRAETGRLLAAMLKNCRSKQAMRAIVFSGGLPPVTLMLHSTHVRMLNEAIVALTVLAATLCGDGDGSSDDAMLVHRHLHMDLVINGIKRCFCETALDVPVEVKMNAVTFTENLLKVQTDEFKQMLRDLNFVEDCFNEEALKTLPNECRNLAERIK